MTWRQDREAELERLLEEATQGEEPLQKALSVIKMMRQALDEDEEWFIECYVDRYRVTRRKPT